MPIIQMNTVSVKNRETQQSCTDTFVTVVYSAVSRLQNIFCKRKTYLEVEFGPGVILGALFQQLTHRPS